MASASSSRTTGASAAGAMTSASTRPTPASPRPAWRPRRQVQRGDDGAFEDLLGGVSGVPDRAGRHAEHDDGARAAAVARRSQGDPRSRPAERRRVRAQARAPVRARRAMRAARRGRAGHPLRTRPRRARCRRRRWSARCGSVSRRAGGFEVVPGVVGMFASGAEPQQSERHRTQRRVAAGPTSAGSAELERVTAPGLRRSGGSPAASAPRGPAPGPRGPRPRPRTGGFRSRTARVRARS